MPTFKLAYDTLDFHVSQGTRSHAELIGRGANYERHVRAIVFPERKAVYFRYFGEPDATDKAFREAGKALDKFIRLGYVKKSWRVLWWTVDEDRVTSRDVKW